MAEGMEEKQDRTEEATPERREEFRERGQVAVSKEITSVFVLAAVTVFLYFYTRIFVEDFLRYMTITFQNIDQIMTVDNLRVHISKVWMQLLLLIAPFFVVSATTALFFTLIQTRFNFSWKKLSPNFKQLNPLAGLQRMVNTQAAMELVKSVGKMAIVGVVSYLILRSEWVKVPALMLYSIEETWVYWGKITYQLFLAVAGLMVLVGALDFIFNFSRLESQMKMTKQEVKEEFKKREVDPQVKAKIKRMQRDLAMAKAIQEVPKATVVITNPEHYAVALFYELGMGAPIVLAKGQDYMAQRMKEVAFEHQVPIMENKPLARTLFKMVEVGQEIPEALYKAVSEVVRYVFLMKGKALSRR